MLAWVATGLASLLAVAAALRRWSNWQRKQAAARIVSAIRAGDLPGLSIALREPPGLDAVTEWFGDPALILAIRSAPSFPGSDCTIKVLRLLLAHGADVDERGAEWQTALMHAAATGCRERCELLLSHGADSGAQDMFGRKALYWAELGGYEDLARLLRSASE